MKAGDAEYDALVRKLMGPKYPDADKDAKAVIDC